MKHTPKLRTLVLSLMLCASLILSTFSGCAGKQTAPTAEPVLETATEVTVPPTATPTVEVAAEPVAETAVVPVSQVVSVPEGYTLSRVVLLSRHNIRSPLSGAGSTLGKMTTQPWIDWSAPTGELTLRGGLQEAAMGQYFRKYLVEQGLISENWLPSENEVRFYANSMQRTIATAQYFSSGLLPVANQVIEHHYNLGTMDPVFTPQLTYVDDDYRIQALAEIAAMGGDRGLEGVAASLQENFRLLEGVLDFQNSEYAKENNLTALPDNPVEIHLEVNKEPSMTGCLKTATSASDALVLQYFEEPDDARAGFGKTLSWEQWCDIAHITDTYTNVLFTAPSIAVNVAHPLLMELEEELTVEGRKFSFLCGHDSNVASVLAALGVEDYALPQSVSQETPIGCKLMFACWTGEDGGEYVTVSLVYQTVEQLRSCAMLDLSNPPQSVKLSFSGLEENADGLYPMADLLNRFAEAIGAYDLLTGAPMPNAA